LESIPPDSPKEKSWAELVASEVDSKVMAVAAVMSALQRLDKGYVQQDIKELEEINKHKVCVIIHGLKGPTNGNRLETRFS